MPLLGYLIYSIDHCGFYYVFIVFEEAFVHLIFPSLQYPLFPFMSTFGKSDDRHVKLEYILFLCARVRSGWGLFDSKEVVTVLYCLLKSSVYNQ